MTLTVVVGSSGSGKTTFLEHVHKLHSCTYLRQYHTLRPYVPVKNIPDFDPTQELHGEGAGTQCVGRGRTVGRGH